MKKFSRFKSIIVVTSLFIIATSIFTCPLIFKMNSSVYGPFFGTDVRAAVWFLWWLKSAYLSGINNDLCFYVCAPFGYDASFAFPFPVTFTLSKWMTILTNPVFFLNITLMLGFVLSGIFTYLLVEYLTENRLAALFSGIIFAFSPYHLNKLMEFCFVYHGYWIVLFMFLLFKLKQKRSLKIIILASLVLFTQIDFNVYFALFIIILTLGLLVFCLIYKWKDKVELLSDRNMSSELKKRLKGGVRYVCAVLLIFLLAFLLSAPSLFPMVKNAFFASAGQNVFRHQEYRRAFDYLFVQSARPLSYFLPASTHPVFGDFTKRMFGSIFYGRGAVEQTLFLGWSPLLLAFAAFWRWRHRRRHPEKFPDYAASTEDFMVGFFIFMAVLAFLFSMPPFFDFLIFKIYFPAFFVYKVLPMFRAYARIGIIVSLCVSILAGYGLKALLEWFKSRRARLCVVSFFVFVVLFEFANFPPSRVTDISKTPQVYKWLSGKKGDFIVVEYPVALGKRGEAWTNYDYLFYQTVHGKRIFNGCPQGSRGYKTKLSILEVDNPDTPRILKSLGVKYIILHKDLYRIGEYKETVSVVRLVPDLEKLNAYRLIKSFADVEVYEVD